MPPSLHASSSSVMGAPTRAFHIRIGSASLSTSLIASLIACRCPRAFHIRCLDPPLACVPEGDWYCLLCVPGAGAGAVASAGAGAVSGEALVGAVSGEALVGGRIEILWPLDEAWYEALVSAYDDATKRHEVRYRLPATGYRLPATGYRLPAVVDDDVVESLDPEGL